MKLFHQTGHNYKWNLECLENGSGDGLIWSPINIDADRLSEKIKESIKATSFLDPQLYLLADGKNNLPTYPYFPGNIKTDFTTHDLNDEGEIIAQYCVDFQQANKFKYIVIPTKYFEENPSNYLYQLYDYFVRPFTDYIDEQFLTTQVLLSIIVKDSVVTDTIRRNDFLNWVTGLQKIHGVYLIFENNGKSKQIKNPDFLLNALKIIDILKENALEVHLGYTNTESLLYSIAMPDSVSMGSYENLRSFAIRRFQDSPTTPMHAPNARLYSSKLLQWIDWAYVASIKDLVDDYDKYFDDSQYNPLTVFKPDMDWQYKTREPYSHYFTVFAKQVKKLPSNQNERIEHIENLIKNAMNNYQTLSQKISFDDKSDGSHLYIWMNVLKSFIKYKKG